jgi:hypothetical protein
MFTSKLFNQIYYFIIFNCFLSLLVEKNPSPNDHIKLQIEDKKYNHLMPDQITTIID